MFLIGAVASHCHDDNGSIEPRLKENRQATTAGGRPISLFTTTHCWCGAQLFSALRVIDALVDSNVKAATDFIVVTFTFFFWKKENKRLIKATPPTRWRVFNDTHHGGWYVLHRPNSALYYSADFTLSDYYVIKLWSIIESTRSWPTSDIKVE